MKSQRAPTKPPLSKTYIAVNVLMNFGKRQYPYVHGSPFIYERILPTMQGSTLFWDHLKAQLKG